LTVAELMRFHARHKLLLMAHSPDAYRTLGPLVAAATPLDVAQRVADYRSTFEAALAQPATSARHVNVLQHIVGYFRRVATREEKAEMAAAIAAYQSGLVPLDLPVTMLARHAKNYGVQYLIDQVYLERPMGGSGLPTSSR
jgi:uncharacterized protein YbgA (DUF1722 family)